MINNLTLTELIPYLIISCVIGTRFLCKNSPKLIWALILFSVLICCFYSKIFLEGGIFLLILSLAVFGLNKIGKNWALFLCIVLLSITSYLHFIPGFNNYLYFDQIVFSKDAWPFTLYMNYNKAIVALILSMAFGTIISDASLFKKEIIKTIFGGFLIVVLIALAIGFIRFEFKIPDIFWPWAFNNLVFVCFAEEILFRGFIQRNLEMYTKSPIISIAISAALFGGYHYTGGIAYIMLSTVAGLFYGYIYHQTKRIETSTAFHFILNVFHILFFTYPALKY